MKKWLAVMLTGIILTVSASCCAEYRQFRLAEGDIGGAAGIVPLDAHNAVVIARPAGTFSVPSVFSLYSWFHIPLYIFAQQPGPK